jgi:hypothetical protein
MAQPCACHEVRRNHPGAPVIFLSDHMDEAAVDTALNAGAESSLEPRLSIGRPSPRRSAMPSTSIARNGNRQKTEDTLRKLWRAIEQSADMVMITDREGIIE